MLLSKRKIYQSIKLPGDRLAANGDWCRWTRGVQRRRFNSWTKDSLSHSELCENIVAEGKGVEKSVSNCFLQVPVFTTMTQCADFQLEEIARKHWKRSAISGIVCSSSPVSALAWWQEAAKAWSFSTLRHLESKQEHLPSNPPEQLEKGRTLSSLVKKSQQVFSQVTFNLPQENRSSWAHSTVLILPEDLASPEVWEELEHQFSKRFMQQQFCLPCRIQASQKLMQP
nr:PREDICTED: uncharacterized protein LOC102274247 [Bos mutus]